MEPSANSTDFQASAPTWEHVDKRWYRSPLFFKALHLWEDRVVTFLFGHTDLDDDLDWRPVRPLGEGGYGIVGLWQKFDKNDTVIDSMAIKQQKYRSTPESQAYFTVGDEGLAMEATLMVQLNETEDRNIIRLRGFKNNSFNKLWRFYFEFAPWGDMRILKNNYRAWNTYLPEEFLWHVFHGLANAAYGLAESSFEDTETGENYKEGEAVVVHFDLKPENVFLGDPIDEPRIHFQNYPTVKLADFGLARLTHRDDYYNPRHYRNLGTQGYRPPVRYLDKSLWLANANYGLGANRCYSSLACSTRSWELSK